MQFLHSVYSPHRGDVSRHSPWDAQERRVRKWLLSDARSLITPFPAQRAMLQADFSPREVTCALSILWASEHICTSWGKLTQVRMNQGDWERSGSHHLTSATLHLSCSTSEQHQSYFFPNEWNIFNHPEQISLTRLQNVQTLSLFLIIHN